MNNTNQTPSYQSLDEIQTRKDQLREEIGKDDEKIKDLWETLFHNPDINSAAPSKRVNALMNTGIGIVDGLLLGWKLYRKFNGIRLLKRF
jgi:hypothetical protein